MVRRDFIHNVARGGLLATLAAFSGFLVSRKQVTLQTDCAENFQCRSCSKLKGCELPEAEIMRDHGEEGQGEG